ncbi:Uncharacterized protein AXF42_Ash008075 [Apostasia shenzhenica]|uniref:Probable zinc-ribbon domain-containing protein n=1 Tax=Apostasia shenzhenica TaxID=1088818 RepID=A0A2I0A8I2_9ASPA|nr:Uncharacterized protein AXF42_Ash008075 [Apostasia shenzhenica]
MSRRTFRLERVSESIGGESNGEDVGYFQTEQQLNKLSLKGRNSCKEIAANDSKLKCIDEAHVRLFNSMNSHQSSICEACSRCSYHSSVKEQVKNSSMKEKKHQAMRHCRPIFNAAPFFTCNKCFKLLQLPEDFLVSKRGLKKLRCGACAEVLVLSFSSASLKERSCFHGRKGKEEVPPLHQLMGYFSATELLCQVSEEDEGYESSEPAMPDSYKVYEKVRKNQLLQQVKDEVENDDSYKILRKTALPPLNSLVKGVRRTWARNSGSMKLKAPVKQ